MLALLVYAFAVAALGAVIGFFAVLSDSPIVAVLLPLLFGLIAGASGIYVSRTDISQRAGRRHLGYLGACIIMFLVGLLGAAVPTLLYRIAPLTPDLARRAAFSGNDAQLMLDLVELRRVSALLGVSDDERDRILRAAEGASPAGRTAMLDRVHSWVDAQEPPRRDLSVPHLLDHDALRPDEQVTDGILRPMFVLPTD